MRTQLLRKGIANVLGIAIVLVVLAKSSPADIIWSGAGATGQDPFGHTWLTSSPGIQSIANWGIPGRGLGTVLYLGNVSITGVEATFFGLPNGVTILPISSPFRPFMNVTPFSVADLWVTSIIGNTILFTPPTPIQTLDPGDRFFFHATFSAPIDVNAFSFQARYLTASNPAVPEPSSMLLMAAGGAGLAGWRRMRRNTVRRAT